MLLLHWQCILIHCHAENEATVNLMLCKYGGSKPDGTFLH